MDDDIDTETVAISGVAAFGAELARGLTMPRTGGDTPEVYACAVCHALFIPGGGPDNICGTPPASVPAGEMRRFGPDTFTVPNKAKDGTRTLDRENESDAELVAQADAFRRGECPACGAENPIMSKVVL